MTLPVLSPRGAARDRFLAPAALPSTPADPGLPRDLLAAAALRPEGFERVALAWELLRCAPGLAPADHRPVLLLVLAALQAADEGSTRLPVSGPSAPSFSRLLTAAGARPGDEAELATLLERLRTGLHPANALIGLDPTLPRPLVLAGDYLQAQSHLVLERRVAAALRQRLVAPPRTWAHAVERALAEVEADPPQRSGRAVRLSSEQREAVRRAASGALTVISGGPGTGKTSIVFALLRVLLRAGLASAQLALAAPTGKAGQRLADALRAGLAQLPLVAPADLALASELPPAVTLHRLLGYSPELDRFRHDARDPLPARVVIVDEGSMIDLRLMDHLLGAVSPDAALVLLGDGHQLPAVESGAVFRELVPPPDGLDTDRRRSAAVRLTHSFRMDSGDPDGLRILSAAAAVNAGTPELLDGAGDAGVPTRASAALLEFRGVEHVELGFTGARDAFVDAWFRRARGDGRVDGLLRRVWRVGPAGFDAAETAELELVRGHFDARRLLTVLRAAGAPSGAPALNAAFRRRLVEVDAPAGWSGAAALPGEPVMVVRNDYRRCLFNGDQGFVLRAASPRRSPEPFAVFPRQGGFVAFPLASLSGDVEPAWAITVHKAQGSEYDEVALVLPDDDLPLWTRELLYTAVTRSRRSVVLAGRRDLLALAARRPVERFGGLAELLNDHPDGGGRSPVRSP